MKLRCLFVVVVNLFCSIFAQADPQIILKLQGSNTVGAQLAPMLAKRFLEQRNIKDVSIKPAAVENEFLVSGTDDSTHQIVAISVAAHGSATGFQALARGEADIAMASRAIKADELQLLSTFGDMRSSAAEHALAIDGLAVLVNKKNPISNLSKDQISALFSGSIKNWKEIGGDNIPVVIYARDEKSGTWDTFKELILGKEKQLDGAAQRFESNDKLSESVANNIGAIGFTGLASIHNAKAVAVFENKIAALPPAIATVATEDYLLTRRLFLYSPPNSNSDVAKAFVEYCLSAAGQQIVAQIGFVSQNIGEFAQAINAAAPQQYKNITGSAKRLSVNFRFKGESAQLDNKAMRDIDRLVDFLKQPANADKKIYLIGFSSVQKNEMRDSVLSRFRALAVRAALMNKNVSISDVAGLGSEMPVASSGENAELKNNRVEVWVRAEGEL